ncbi:hypothetical protein [Amycolatopsis sp. cmx-11-51]|uniref:hypothetical protein n=1 Tax=Amycolatopsis sp. cmx-11-51 TaxID=2785797 RepID=UPI0039E54D03
MAFATPGMAARAPCELLLAMAANSLGTACLALGETSSTGLGQHHLALETARRIGYRLQEARALAGIGQARAARDLYAAMGPPAEPLKVVT